jgi:malate dehydrogenase (oxaloacetate-decarboxylating)(NADP+)
VIGVSLVLARGRTVLVADTAVTEMPDGPDIAEDRGRGRGGRAQARLRAARRAAVVLDLRAPAGERAEKVQHAVRILDSRRVDFEYDGEMAADVALSPDLMAAYPFCRLSGRPTCW